MIHPDFRLIDGKSNSTQCGPVIIGPDVTDIVTALSDLESGTKDFCALLRKAAPLPHDLKHDIYLQTSGTTGQPKLIGHNLTGLTGRIKAVDPNQNGSQEVWLLSYEPASFAGLQVILTACLRGATLVVGGVEEALTHGVTHISGTPTFWRVFLSILGQRPLNLQAATLGGEIADQAILDLLKTKFPNAHISHIYASTEAGAVFAVQDGLAGFPIEWFKQAPDGVYLRLDEHNVLEVKSPRATRETWINTGDLIEIRGPRAFFSGRTDDMINVGGTKITPITIEDRALSVQGVADAVCYGKSNPITGQIVVLEVTPLAGQDENELKSRLQAALSDLDRAAQPRLIRLVKQIRTGTGNKKIRSE